MDSGTLFPESSNNPLTRGIAVGDKRRTCSKRHVVVYHVPPGEAGLENVPLLNTTQTRTGPDSFQRI